MSRPALAQQGPAPKPGRRGEPARKASSGRRWRGRAAPLPGALSATLLAAAWATLLGSGCAALDPVRHADSMAASAGLVRETVRAAPFVLTAFVRIARPDRPLRVYIEGDGLAWITRSEPSLDPTPHRATGLALAAADPAPNVVYLARPCQFTPMSMNPACGVPYWTTRRFSPEVVRSLDEAVSDFAARVPGQPVELVGYSGGGAIAVLVAARRHDVASIRTVAGNLDDAFVNQLHHVSSMPESENPIDYAPRVAGIAQLHFAGSDDAVVPPEVARRFVAASGSPCVRMQTVDHVAHEGAWEKRWPALLGIAPSCTPLSATQAAIQAATQAARDTDLTQ